MAGHARLKFVMTECSKTQIRLTGLNLTSFNILDPSGRNLFDLLGDFGFDNQGSSFCGEFLAGLTYIGRRLILDKEITK